MIQLHCITGKILDAITISSKSITFHTKLPGSGRLMRASTSPTLSEAFLFLPMPIPDILDN